MMRVIGFSTLVFAAGSLLGPLLRWATWPPSKFMEGPLLPIGDFIYYLVLLLWPAQLLAVMEVSTGRLVAGIVAVGVNILLFGLVGVVAGIFAKRRLALLALYLLTCILVLCFAVWAVGSLADTNIYSLVVALLLYAIPFWVITRLNNPGRCPVRMSGE